MELNLCKSFVDQPPADEIYGYPIMQYIAKNSHLA